jgi:excisionase family DNA binding protein
MDSARVMTLNELADYLRVHPSTIYRLLKRRGLPAFKVGSDWRFNSESIDRWLLEREQSEGQGGGRPKVDNQLADG